MNTPNKLTILRILLVPFFVAALLLAVIPHHFLIAGLIFGVASLTDLLDGKLARKRGQITDFGKFADPLADKILVISALICFVQLGIIGAVPVIVLLFREFAVTSIRLVAASNGKVVAANLWGKAKTVKPDDSGGMRVYFAVYFGACRYGCFFDFPRHGNSLFDYNQRTGLDFCFACRDFRRSLSV